MLQFGLHDSFGTAPDRVHVLARETLVDLYFEVQSP